MTDTTPSESLAVYRKNPHYLEYRGRPIFLIGNTHGGGWTPISDSTFDIDTDIRVLTESGGNYVRIVPYYPGQDLLPWRRQNNAYRLDEIDSEWSDRLSYFLQVCADAAVVVQLEIFDNWSIVHQEHDARARNNWHAHPFNPTNCDGQTAQWLTASTSRSETPFYSSVPERPCTAGLLDLQKQYVNAVLDASLRFDNVMYSIGNESCAPFAWSRYWSHYVRNYCEKRGAKRLIGDMPNADPESTPVSAFLRDPLFDFVDVSQVTSHNPNAAGRFGEPSIASTSLALLKNWYREMNHTGIKPLTCAKVYCRHPIAAFAKLFGGCASVRFHRPSQLYAHRGDSEVFDAVTALRAVSSLIDLETACAHPFIDPGPDKSVDGHFICGTMGLGSGSFALYLADPYGGLNRGGEIRVIDADRDLNVKAIRPDTAAEVADAGRAIRAESGTVTIPVPEFSEHLVLLAGHE